MPTAPPQLIPDQRPDAVRDARGRAVPLVHAADAPARLTANERWQVRRGRSGFLRTVLPYSLLVYASLFLGYQWGFRHGFDPAWLISAQFWTTSGVFFGVYCVFAMLGGRRRARSEIAETIPACIAHRVCPACLYDLSEIPADADGLTVCPECDGAWRLPIPRAGV